MGRVKQPNGKHLPPDESLAQRREVLEAIRVLIGTNTEFGTKEVILAGDRLRDAIGAIGGRGRNNKGGLYAYQIPRVLRVVRGWVDTGLCLLEVAEKRWTLKAQPKQQPTEYLREAPRVGDGGRLVEGALVRDQHGNTIPAHREAAPDPKPPEPQRADYFDSQRPWIKERRQPTRAELARQHEHVQAVARNGMHPDQAFIDACTARNNRGY